jgi:hypothetical protein
VSDRSFASPKRRTRQLPPEAETEIAQMEAALRERFGDDHELLRPGVFRGTLWLQAAACALDDERPSR